MKISRYLLIYCCVILFTFILISACSLLPDQATPVMRNDIVPEMGMDRSGGMMSRHHTDIPNIYVGKVSPIENDDQSIERGQAIYQIQCESCHGEFGLGDGVAGMNLDPVPAPVGRTSLMLSDEYLFWRITEGGVTFGTAMPSYESILDDNERWDVINYLRYLGITAGTIDENLGSSFDEQSEQEHITMVEEATQLGLITQEGGEIFLSLHALIEEYIVAQPHLISPGGMDNNLIEIFNAMIADGLINQEQADIFLSVHAKLDDAGLMR